jgi:hypothetical protein
VDGGFRGWRRGLRLRRQFAGGDRDGRDGLRLLDADDRRDAVIGGFVRAVRAVFNMIRLPFDPPAASSADKESFGPPPWRNFGKQTANQGILRAIVTVSPSSNQPFRESKDILYKYCFLQDSRSAELGIHNIQMSG